MKMTECPECGGRTFIVHAEHNLNCDGVHCDELGCPVPVQEECPTCHGTGKVEVPPCVPDSAHKWNSGVRTEGVEGGYVYTCTVCGFKKNGWRVFRPSNKPDSRVRMTKKQRRKLNAKK